MRFVTHTGEKTLEMSDQAQTDDRGIYRVWGLKARLSRQRRPRNSTFGENAEVACAMIDALVNSCGRWPGSGAVPLNAGRGAGALQRIEDIASRNQAVAQQPQAEARMRRCTRDDVIDLRVTVTLNVGEERPAWTSTPTGRDDDGVEPRDELGWRDSARHADFARRTNRRSHRPRRRQYSARDKTASSASTA
jgi:hypothetical protein